MKPINCSSAEMSFKLRFAHNVIFIGRVNQPNKQKQHTSKKLNVNFNTSHRHFTSKKEESKIKLAIFLQFNRIWFYTD